jgi:hypothetical protein
MLIANSRPRMNSASRTSVISRIGLRHSMFALLVSISMTLVVAPSNWSEASDIIDQNRRMVDSVDGDRIVSTVTDLQNFGSRAFFVDSMRNASIYIHDRFAELGLWVMYQDFQVKGYSQRNVVAVLNGTDPAAPQYLFGAHYDSITMDLLDYEAGGLMPAPGADDDASGVAATMELATVLHDKKFNNTIKFVAFAAEETGLNGSSVFVQEELASGVVYADTAIMDMIGYRESEQNKAFIFRGTNENTLSGSVQRSVYTHGLNLSLTFVSGTSFGYSDHYPFWVAGYPSMLVIEDLVDGWPVNPYYHTENDTVAHLSEEQMTVITKALLGGFLGLQSPQKERTSNEGVLIVLAIVVVAVAIVVSLYIIKKRKAVQ